MSRPFPGVTCTGKPERLVHRCRQLLLVALSALVLAGCVPAPLVPPTPTAGPEQLSTATSTPQPTPTCTPLPTWTPIPTSTPLPPPRVGTVVEGSIARQESLTVDKVDKVLGALFPEDTCPASLYPVDVYRLQFRTRDRVGKEVVIQADVRFPRVGTETAFPLFVYGSGTTGVANECATLKEYPADRHWGNYRAHLSAYATQGYITAIANWQGFDDPNETHPYFVAELEGYVMLDLTRAIYDFFSAPPSEEVLARPADAVFFGGYSQGGHGAFAADAMAPRYAPELNIVGVVGHAVAPDVRGLMDDSPLYAPYIVYAYRDYYGERIVHPQDLFQEPWMATFKRDVSMCIDDALHYYPNTHDSMYTPRFREALQNDRLAEEFPEFKALLDLNYIGRDVNPSTPAIILHGKADPIVRLRTVEPFVRRLCEENKSVTYRLYPDVNHFKIRQVSHIDSLAWMEARLAGEAPESDCGRLAQP